MKKMFTLVAALALMIGISVASWFYWPIYQAHAHVKQALNDPDSAQFFDVEFFRKTGGACGFVNAKNKMGGYVGKTEFSATQAGEVKFRPNANTETGTTQEQILALESLIAYATFAATNCPASNK